MVHAGCVFVASIHPSRAWMTGSFESVRWDECAHRLDLGLYSHLRVLGGMESQPMFTPREKYPPPVAQRSVDLVTQHHAGRRAQHTTVWFIPAPGITRLIWWSLLLGGGGGGGSFQMLCKPEQYACIDSLSMFLVIKCRSKIRNICHEITVVHSWFFFVLLFVSLFYDPLGSFPWKPSRCKTQRNIFCWLHLVT